MTQDAHGGRRHRSPATTLLLATTALLLALAFAGASRASAAQTVVSLTFDDGSKDQYALRQVLASHNMTGTFYVNSALENAGDSYRMTWNQIHDLFNDGNEIGGHSSDHANLTQLTSAAAKSEICDDRQQLIKQGFTPSSFAYPYGAYSAAIEGLVKDCGYTSGRGTNGVVSPFWCPTDCPGPFAEQQIPPDPYSTRTPDDGSGQITLQMMKDNVTQAAAHGGGWIQEVFHNFCTSSCSTGYGWATYADFGAFLDWLQGQPDVAVKTVGEVIDGPNTRPPSVLATTPADGGVNFRTDDPVVVSFSKAVDHTSAQNAFGLTKAGSSTPVPGTFSWSGNSMTFTPSAPLDTAAQYTLTEGTGVQDLSGQNMASAVSVGFSTAPINGFVLQNTSMEDDTNFDNTPDCYDLSGYGTNTFAFARTSDSHTGSFAEKLTMSSWTSGDRKVLVKMDTGTCSPPAKPGHTYKISAWYKSTAPVWFVTYTRDASSGNWNYWKSSPTFAASSTWKQVTYTTPVMPAGVDHLSFGMNMGSTGSFTVDDYWEQDNGAPTVTAVNPQDGDTNVGTGSSVTLTFSNAMDHASTENAFSLATQADGSSSVPGTFAWSADSTQMTFNPSAALKTSTVYRVNEASSAQDISGDRLTAGKTVNFTTAPIAGFVLQNASLEKDANTDGVPDCWQTDGYGTNTFAFSRTSDSHTGDVAENLNMTAWTNGDRKLVVKQDAGTCSPPITAGHTYQLSAWYKSTSPTWFVVYTRNPSNGAWGYWKGSPVFPASSTWKQVTWTTPAAPSGVDRFSFGLNTGSVGSITTDDYWEQDTAP